MNSKLTTFAITGAILLTSINPSYAITQDSVGTTTATTLTSLTLKADTLSTSVLTNVEPLVSNDGSINGFVDGNHVRISSDPNVGISLTREDKLEFQIATPNAEHASDAVSIANGIVAYDNKNGSHSAPIAKSDGSIQITTIILGDASPSEYVFDWSTKFESNMVLNLDGSVSVQDDAGRVVFAFSPPWARDADGLAVPTHYEITGKSLRQKVFHQGGQFKYPITADPWLGTDLIQSEKWILRSNLPAISVTPTLWGRGWTGTSMWGIWWDEFIAKVPTTRLSNGITYSQSSANRNHIRDQQNCHLWFATFKDSWNLDLKTIRNDFWDYVFHSCN